MVSHIATAAFEMTDKTYSIQLAAYITCSLSANGALSWMCVQLDDRSVEVTMEMTTVRLLMGLLRCTALVFKLGGGRGMESVISPGKKDGK